MLYIKLKEREEIEWLSVKASLNKACSDITEKQWPFRVYLLKPKLQKIAKFQRIIARSSFYN